LIFPDHNPSHVCKPQDENPSYGKYKTTFLSLIQTSLTSVMSVTDAGGLWIRPVKVCSFLPTAHPPCSSPPSSLVCLLFFFPNQQMFSRQQSRILLHLEPEPSSDGLALIFTNGSGTLEPQWPFLPQSSLLPTLPKAINKKRESKAQTYY